MALTPRVWPLVMNAIKNRHSMALTSNNQKVKLMFPMGQSSHFCTSLLRFEGEVKPSPSLTGHKPNGLEKKLLVWLKKYPSEAEIPNFIPQATMEKVRNQARIRLNLLFCVMTAFVSWILIMKSKRNAEAGDTIFKQNEETHKKYEG